MDLASHVRHDAFWRLWRVYVLFMVMGLFVSCFFMLPVDEQEVDTALRRLFGRSPAVLFGTEYPCGLLLVPLMLGFTFPFLGFVAGSLLSQVEKPVYRLYAALPMSSVQRGRVMWWRQAIIAPALVWVVPVTLTALWLNVDPTPWRALMFMASWRAFLTSLAVSALLLIAGARPLSDVGPGLGLLGWAVTVPVTLLHYAAFLRFGFGAFGAVSWLLFLPPVALLLGLSYARATRLALANPARQPWLVWPLEPNRPESAAGLILREALGTIGATYFVCVAVAAALSQLSTDRLFYFFALDCMLAGILTFAMFIASGRYVSEHLRLLRLLPLNPNRIALAALLYPIAVAVLTVPAIVLLILLATPGRSPFVIAGAIFLAADAGCLAVALQVRLSRWAVQANLFFFSVSFLVMMALCMPIHERPAIESSSLLAAVLAAFAPCLAIGYFSLRKAIQTTSAGAYKDLFQQFAPQ